MYNLVEDKILFDNDKLFKTLKPIGYGSHSDIYKLKIGNEFYAVKKYNWLYDESVENIERKLSINIPSYVTPKRILYINGKFEGYIMLFCKGKDLEKRKLDISINEFSRCTAKLVEDTHKLSQMKYNIYDAYITNIMYDDGFKMIDTDDYFYVPKLSSDEIEYINNKRLNNILLDVFIKNANLSNLYFSNVEFKKFMKRCADGEILFEDVFKILYSCANDIVNGELENISELGEVLVKTKKM